VIAVGNDELLGWAGELGAERLWAVEDCRQLTGWLERQLLSRGEELVRVPPKLTVPERRAGRTRGKSDPIDALAIARAALREPGLSRPRSDERVYRELKLLVDHRDDLVDQRRRSQQRLRWHLHQLDPTFDVPLRRLDRASHPRTRPPLACAPSALQVRLARELLSTIRQLNRTIAELDQELEQRTAEIAPALLELPGCAAVTAALYRIAITQARHYPDARAYLERKRSEGKSRREALRCLKRLLARVVFNKLKASPALT
jgi:transposase